MSLQRVKVYNGIETYYTKNGVKHGKYKKREGDVTVICRYKNGVLHGKFIKYYIHFVPPLFDWNCKKLCFYYNGKQHGQYAVYRYDGVCRIWDDDHVFKNNEIEPYSVEQFYFNQFNKFKNVMRDDSVQYIKSLGFNDYIAADIYDTLADLWWKHKNIRKKLFVL
jgi:hypothetical protein